MPRLAAFAATLPLLCAMGCERSAASLPSPEPVAREPSGAASPPAGSPASPSPGAGERWTDPLRSAPRPSPAPSPSGLGEGRAGAVPSGAEAASSPEPEPTSERVGPERHGEDADPWREAWPERARAFHFVTFVYESGTSDARVLGYLRRGVQLAARPLGRRLVEVPGGVARLREGLVLEPARLLGFVPPLAETRAAVPYRYVRVRAPWTLVLDAPWGDLEALRESVAEQLAALSEGGDGGVHAERDGEAGGWPKGVRDVLRRGFVVVEAAREGREGGEWVRTLRGAWVPAADLAPVLPPRGRGMALGGGRRLPIAFVVAPGAVRWSWDATRGRLVGREVLSPPLALPLHTAEVVRVGGVRGYWTAAGRFLEVSGVRVAAVRPRPESVPSRARWIHVHLPSQTLVAYEGDRPRFATVVSSGRAGFQTPPGRYRIESKHVSITMDDRAGGEPFLLQEVPWTQFFHEGLALHAAYWHDRFGHRRSHGCVNLAPADARWLFRFTEPRLPPGWHGRRVLPEEESSIVWVEGEEGDSSPRPEMMNAWAGHACLPRPDRGLACRRLSALGWCRASPSVASAGVVGARHLRVHGWGAAFLRSRCVRCEPCWRATGRTPPRGARHRGRAACRCVHGRGSGLALLRLPGGLGGTPLLLGVPAAGLYARTPLQLCAQQLDDGRAGA